MITVIIHCSGKKTKIIFCLSVFRDEVKGMIAKKTKGSETLAKFEEEMNEVRFSIPLKYFIALTLRFPAHYFRN